MAMTIYSTQSAANQLASLVEHACLGEEVVITNDQGLLVKLAPMKNHPRSHSFGLLKDELIVDERFFEPLPEAELRAWET
jgi:antitoxin (DNA-binding transcriptional repressor) of toxin-antitoxin stability system